MAWLRPLPTSKNRPIFNWLHWFIGTGSWIIASMDRASFAYLQLLFASRFLFIAAVTIFLSTALGKAGLRRNYGYAADYLMAGYIASFILATIVLEILTAFYTSKAGKAKSIVTFTNGKNFPRSRKIVL